jgi:hypothetical protein
MNEQDLAVIKNSVSIIKSSKLFLDRIKDNEFLMKHLKLDSIEIEKVKESFVKNDENYKQILIQFGSRKYFLLHGFPDDDAVCCILTMDDKKYCITGAYTNPILTENPTKIIPLDISMIKKWYCLLTYEGHLFQDDYWY